MVMELAQESVWFDKWRYDEAERNLHEHNLLVNFVPASSADVDSKEPVDSATEISETTIAPEEANNEKEGLSGIAYKIAKVRQEIANSLTYAPAFQGRNLHKGVDEPVETKCEDPRSASDLINRVTKLEIEKKDLKKNVDYLEKIVKDLSTRLQYIELKSRENASAESKPPTKMQVDEEEDDDDVDLFGSDEEEDEDAARVREERLKAYADKKAKKPGPIAKSSVLLDCKPWDDETDMGQMEAEIRKIEMDGLLWGASKLVPLAYGIKKLSILCTVEDEKVSIDDLTEQICEIEDFVQSVDIGAFNKI